MYLRVMIQSIVFYLNKRKVICPRLKRDFLKYQYNFVWYLFRCIIKRINAATFFTLLRNLPVSPKSVFNTKLFLNFRYEVNSSFILFSILCPELKDNNSESEIFLSDRGNFFLLCT